MRNAAGYEISIGIKLMERSNIQKYSICNLQFQLVRARVSEGYSGSCPGEAYSQAGLQLLMALSLQMQLNGSGTGRDPS